MKDFNNIELIKAYLDGKMSKSDLKDFQRQLSSDNALKTEVEAYKKIFNGFKYLNEEAFEQNVKEWGAALKKKDIQVPIKTKSAKIRPLYRQIAIAASVLLLLGVGTNFWAGQNYSNQALVTNQYQAPISSGTLGETQGDLLKPLKALFETAHTQFQNGENEKSLTSFNNLTAILETNKTKMDGLSWRYYAENTEWTKVLLLLKMNQEETSEFKTLLDKIVNDSGHAYSNQAQELKGNLGSFWRKIS